jgi:hypothetical protein
MSLLGRLFRRDPPEWAGFMAAEEFRRFDHLLRQELRATGVPHRVDMNQGMVHVQHPDGEPHHLGLGNLAQVCHGDPEQMPEHIAQHLRLMIAGHAERESFVESLQGNWEAAAPYLKLRLYPAELGPAAEHLVARRPAEGLLAALVLDLPDSIASVTPELLQSWGRPEADVLDQALAQTRDEPAEETAEQVQGVRVHLIGGDSHFVATRLLWLADALPEAGALVAAPNRHVLVYHPITDLTVVKAVEVVAGLARTFYDQGPGSISPALYWLRGAELMLLPSEFRGDTLHFTPPQRFLDECLGRFAEAEE